MSTRGRLSRFVMVLARDHLPWGVIREVAMALDSSPMSPAESALASELVSELLPEVTTNGLSEDAISQVGRECELTPREVEVLTAIVDGLSRSEIADLLSVSKATVKWHLHNVLNKTGEVSEAGLVRIVVERMNEERR